LTKTESGAECRPKLLPYAAKQELKIRTAEVKKIASKRWRVEAI